ncbi:MAG: DUF3631 domain-containing protein [Terriglobales bacterium]
MTVATISLGLQIPTELLATAGWLDASDLAVREALGQHGFRDSDLSGILMPIRQPRTGAALGNICRVASPPTGAPRYLQEQGNRWLYVPPVPADWLGDVSAPAVIVEGPKSALALLALAQRHSRRIVAVATLGCWGWRRTIGHERNGDGELVPLKGPSPSLDWLSWKGRNAIIALDGDTRTNPSVAAALRGLAQEIARREATVRVAAIPATAGENAGPDDMLEGCGDDAVLAMLDSAKPWPDCALAAADAAVAVLEAMEPQNRKSVELPTAEIADVADPIMRSRFVGRVSALRIPGVARADLEHAIAAHHAEAEAQREAAGKAARKGHLFGLRVDGAVLLNDLVAMLRAYVIETAAQGDIEALWLLHTYCLDAAEYTPYLHITAPEKRCGKSRLLEALELLAARPWRCDRTTAAALLRSVERDLPTLLLDEWDAAGGSGEEYAETMRGLLNSGFRRGGAYRLCIGEDREPHDFPTFCPKAIAGIGKLPDTVADRSLTIALRRKGQNERVRAFHRRDAEPEAGPLRERCEAWALQTAERLRGLRPPVPAELNDRQADICEPLLAIADLAGGNWPERARRALVELCTGETAQDESTGTKLLADCKAIFEGRGVDRLASKELVAALAEREDRPWAEWGRGGKPITPPQLARRLGRFGIKPRNLRDGGTVAKGYLTSDFDDSWACYLPPIKPLGEAPPPSLPVSSRYTATSGVNIDQNSDFQNATGTPCSGSKNGVSSSAGAGCSGVAASNPQDGGSDQGGLFAGDHGTTESQKSIAEAAPAEHRDL